MDFSALMFDYSLEKTALILFGFLIFALFLLIFKKRRGAYPYFARETLLTKAELKFYNVLKAVTAQKYDIACKVRLADIINCTDYDWKRGYGPKISSKHIDFVLIDPKTSQILLCIELDDKSHDLPHRKKRDAFVNNALKSANVRLLRLFVAKGYDIAALDKEVTVYLSKK